MTASPDAPPPPRKLQICVLYPQVMNLYADRGNLTVLQNRCRWRGIEAEMVSAGLGEPIDTEADLYYLGAGQGRDQRVCAEELTSIKREVLHEAAGRGAVILGVGSGYQLLGRSHGTPNGRLPGLGLLDLETVWEPGDRLAGNIVCRTPLASGHQSPAPTGDQPDRSGPGDIRILAGFENHAGRTYLGATAPLGQVLAGHGNNGKDGTEGARGGPHATVIGTYLHGPALSNAWFADWLIATALRMPPSELTPLDDALEEAGHRAACVAAGV